MAQFGFLTANDLRTGQKVFNDDGDAEHGPGPSRDCGQ